MARRLTIAATAYVAAFAAATGLLALAGCAHRETLARAGWLRIDQTQPRELAPHALGVGQKRVEVLVRRDGRWQRVGAYALAGPIVDYANGRYALVPVVGDDGYRTLWLGAGGERLDVPYCPSLRADPGGDTASCVRCDPACERLAVTTYGAPDAAPRAAELAWPPDVCAGRLAVDGGGDVPARADIHWYDGGAGGPAGLRASCLQPAECVYFELDGGVLRELGRRAETCP
jgi:hypothetical protein